MENLTEVITPAGHKVYLKTKLTYGEYKEIEEVQASDYEIDPVTKKIKYYGKAIFDAQRLSIKLIVKKIIDKDGKEYTDNLLAVINGWDKADGEFIEKKINEATKDSGLSPDVKKN